ncbi:hypothetical protein TKK_0016207 [Trichogramma kaykai]|uniref:Uncharacterized protein n=1 Tax=Trichogramma kaykai TaxID=54128 RepID=A0ABD2W7Q2_9HYME
MPKKEKPPIRRKNVEKALELFKKAKKDPKSKSNSSSTHHDVVGKTKRSIATSVLPYSVVSEMRSCLMRHDWINLQRLFPFLLDISNGHNQTLIWRYAFTIMFHSPMSDMQRLGEFLNQCVGCTAENFDFMVNQLCTLQNPSDIKNTKL